MFGLTAFAQSSYAALGGNTYLQNILESIAANDSYANLISIPVFITESSTPTATAYSVHVLNTAIAETAAAATSFAATLIALESLNESIAASDSVFQVTGQFVFLTETAAINDAYEPYGSVYGASIDESQTIQDTVANGTILSTTITESLVTSEAQTVTQIMNEVLTESASPMDVYSAVLNLVQYVNEITPANDYQAAGITAYFTVNEAVSATATETAANVLSVLLTENSTASESQLGTLVQIAEIIETAGIAENMTYTVDTKGVVTGILLTINLSSPLVWDKIQDNQTPNWLTTNAGQQAGWQKIDADQSSDWVEIKN